MTATEAVRGGAIGPAVAPTSDTTNVSGDAYQHHPGRTFVIGAPEIHTTAHYLCRAAEGVVYSTSDELPGDLRPDDLLLVVDPGPRSWPIGFERVPCVCALYLIDVHQGLQERLDWVPMFDAVFVAQPEYIPEVRRVADASVVEWVPLAADPAIHHVPGMHRRHDVAFVGQLGRPGSARARTLSHVLGRFATNEWRRFHAPSEMGRVYSQAKVVINAAVNGDLNMRAFEAMAAGALLVTDRIRNGLDDLFVEGVHYLGYDTPDEAVALIEAALHDEEGRTRVASAGQAVVLRQHTYAHRYRRMAEVVASLGDERPARARAATRAERAHMYARVHEAKRDVGSILALLLREGMAPSIVPYAARTVGRWVNQRVPLTARARAARRVRP